MNHSGASSASEMAVQAELAEPPVPVRAVMLQALRALARGHHIIRLGDSAVLTQLEGVPRVVIVFDYLLKYGHITTVGKTGLEAVRYQITTKGKELHASGESWWGSLTRGQRFWSLMSA